jgi:uncharacterized membrane protein
MVTSKLIKWGLGFSLIGLIDSTYLFWIKISDSEAACFGGCDTVNSSPYSQIWGIPIALFGAGAYLIICFLLIYDSKIPLLSSYGSSIFLGITLIGVIYSAYLTFLEIAVIHAICPYCVISAVLMLLLFLISLLRLKQEFDMLE